MNSCRLWGIWLGLFLFGLGLLPAFQSVYGQSFDQAESLEQAGEYAEALNDYQRILEDQPQHLEARRGALRTAVRVEAWDAADTHIQQLERRDPRRDETARWAVRAHYRQDQMDTAIQWGERYRERASSSWEPFHALTRMHLDRSAFLAAAETLQAAQARAPDEPWVLADQVELTARTEDEIDQQALEDLLDQDASPTVYWTLLNKLGERFENQQIRALLNSALESEATEEPPLVRPVEESTLRYWQARFLAVAEQYDAARDVLADTPLTRRNQWLAQRLRSSGDRLEAQQELLRSNPDEVPWLWQQSVDLRNHRLVGNDLRAEASDWLYEQFERTRFWNYRAAMLSSLARSLELHPIHAERQFDLVQLFNEWEWGIAERTAFERVEELGLTPETRMEDYRAGLEPVPGPTPPDTRVAQVGLAVSVESDWDGPYQGQNTLLGMLNQALYHQPYFQADAVQEPPDRASDLVPEDGEDAGGLLVRVHRWDDVLRAELAFRDPTGQFHSRTVRLRGPLKTWGLIHQTMEMLRERWPWEAKLYETEWPYGWLDLGRAHGIEPDEVFVLDGREYEIEQLHQDRLQLQFPSPVERTLLQRGRTTNRE